MDESYLRNFDVKTGRATEPGTRSRNIVEFFSHSFQNDTESEKAGRPIFINVDMIRIIQPGDRNSMVERKARKDDQAAYPREWEAYRRAEELVHSGTPLEHWPLLDRAKVRELKFFNIHTVEQLADLGEGVRNQMGMMGLSTLCKQAKAFLVHAESGKLPAAMVAENDRLKDQVARLEQQMRDMSTQFEIRMKDVGKSAVDMPAPVVEKAAVVTETAPAIPDDFAKMSDKQVIDMARSITGFAFKRRAEAEEALRDIKTK